MCIFLIKTKMNLIKSILLNTGKKGGDLLPAFNLIPLADNKLIPAFLH